MARRQEQEPARPEVTEVAPDVLRMQLPIRMPGLGHVNCYAILDGDGAAIVDPGLPGPASWKALQARLRQAELAVRHVHTVFVTHSHPDHFGCAARFAKEAGAEVVAHHTFRFGPVGPPAHAEASVEDVQAQRDAEASSRDEAGESEDAPEEEAPAFTSWGGPTPWGGRGPRPPWRSRLRWRLMRWLGGSFLPTITRPVEHEDVLRLGGRDWFVLHTPGHTADHVCLHDPASGIFLAGDHVLPSITPHISGLTAVADPLSQFFYSLDRVGEISGVKNVLPAHGHPFEDLRGRTEAIKRHHFERLDKVKAIGREIGPATVGDFSRRLFQPRSWGAMAESETYAHLEHLRLAGEAERRDGADRGYLYETS
jgi:glyoxylase-like metal-dependent hydrolase (beta-lactamase superfamily II)